MLREAERTSSPAWKRLLPITMDYFCCDCIGLRNGIRSASRRDLAADLDNGPVPQIASSGWVGVGWGEVGTNKNRLFCEYWLVCLDWRFGALLSLYLRDQPGTHSHH